MRPGLTLLELTITITFLGILAALAVRPVGRRLDQAAVAAAAAEATAAFALARDHAAAEARSVAVSIDERGGNLTVHAAGDTLHHRALHAAYDVVLHTTRDSMAYAPNGLGTGAANLTLILRRGSAASTIRVSRLGRVR